MKQRSGNLQPRNVTANDSNRSIIVYGQIREYSTITNVPNSTVTCVSKLHNADLHFLHVRRCRIW